MTFIIDGKRIAAKIKEEVKEDLSDLQSSWSIGKPHLAVVLWTDDPASESYVKSKTKACAEIGIESFVYKKYDNDLFQTIDNLNKSKNIHGILVQLPVPGENNYDIFDTIDPLKDVDGFSPINTGLLLQGRPRFVPCTPLAVQKMLVYSGIRPAGKKVAIINRSDIVGKPLQALLSQNNDNGNATATLCHDQTPPEVLEEICVKSDIIVVAVGKPNFLTAKMVTSKSVVIDVGINRVNGKIVGDVHPEVTNKVAAISPVPGGVGPCTVACLLHNTLQTYRYLVEDLQHGR